MEKLYQDRGWLWECYVVREELMSVMAEKAGCGETTIWRWLHKSGVPIRGHDGLWRNKDWLWGHYIEREESSVAMAREAGCDPVTINNWLRKNNIPVRSRGEGLHLATRNSAIITPDLLKFMGGEIIGDGRVGMNGNYSARYSHSSKYEKYLIWLSGCFSRWGIEQSGCITDHKDKETGAIYYQYASRSYPELVPIWRRWYIERDGKMKKTVPKDLELTPIMTRQWYLGDGGLKHPKCSRPYINLSTNDFDRLSINHLIEELGKLGFKATHQLSDNTINISVYSTQDFLEWIGPCPIACYQYKWDYSG